LAHDLALSGEVLFQAMKNINPNNGIQKLKKAKPNEDLSSESVVAVAPRTEDDTGATRQPHLGQISAAFLIIPPQWEQYISSLLICRTSLIFFLSLKFNTRVNIFGKK